MRRKLAIEVQQVKSSGGSGFEICALSTAECTRPRYAAAEGGGGGSYNPTYKNVIRPAQLGRGPYSVQNDPPRHGARPPASFN